MAQQIATLLFFSIAMSGCVHSSTRLRNDYILEPVAPVGSQWFNADEGTKACGVAVMIHGLNMNPQKFADLIRVFNKSGVAVLRTSLSGHRGDIEEFKQVTREAWLADAYRAYHAARTVADDKALPLYFVGYSLGALVNGDLMTLYGEEKVKYDKLILFAPAFTTRWFSRLVLVFAPLGSRFVLPSGAPPTYDANPGTPMAAYEALLQAKAAVKEANFRHLNVPTLIFLDKNDELISHRSLENVIKNFDLSHWHIEYIDNTNGTVMPRYHHMIIDEASNGPETWAHITAKVNEFLSCESGTR